MAMDFTWPAAVVLMADAFYSPKSIVTMAGAFYMASAERYHGRRTQG